MKDPVYKLLINDTDVFFKQLATLFIFEGLPPLRTIQVDAAAPKELTTDKPIFTAIEN